MDNFLVECIGCDVYAQLDDLGLCPECAKKLDRDLIRAGDWEYSVSTFSISPAEREVLRSKVIKKYGSKYELIIPKTKPKKRRSSRKKQR
ncbi:MAG: hypothetical protein A2Z14_16825 [Chloroflexi bacterium RBG_16_48_8]|nr:MAG: hypothetical protein A2Z14_16825 [Chloroflexi bacterium RBG_16_48_8]